MEIYQEKIGLFSAKKNKRSHDIGIIGMACRFPGANNYQEYWANLVEGKNSISEIPLDRWDINEYYSPDISQPNKSVSKWGGLLDDIASFDRSLPPTLRNNNSTNW